MSEWDWDGSGPVIDIADHEGLAWESDEAHAAESSVEVDMAYDEFNNSCSQVGTAERALLSRLRKDLYSALQTADYVLEPFGSYVTGLGLREDRGQERSDLDVVLLFKKHPADSIESKGNGIRENLVSPTINKLGRWLQFQPGFTVKNVIRKARVPIVMFETKELCIDISVQQPFGVLNSWHLRDLCASGWHGRLRALIRLVKKWAKSKAIHTAKDGALSSYGYAMLAVSFLQDINALPAILRNATEAAGPCGPYMDGDEALRHVLSASDGSPGMLWKPKPTAPAVENAAEALLLPAELFTAWLQWMSSTVFGHLEADPSRENAGAVPLSERHLVSVRGKTQQELLADITWSPKVDEHWTPQRNEVFLCIEEPFNGENVARCVRAEGFAAIREEVARGLEYMAHMSSDNAMACFESLLLEPPRSRRAQPPNGVGLGGFKRPFGQQGHAEAPAWKLQKQAHGQFSSMGKGAPFRGVAAVPTGFGSHAARPMRPQLARVPPSHPPPQHLMQARYPGAMPPRLSSFAPPKATGQRQLTAIRPIAGKGGKIAGIPGKGAFHPVGYGGKHR